jgi:uncharacterized protein YqeY
MRIQEQIDLHLTNAILTSNKEVKSILRVLIGEFNRVDKIVSDEKAISIIKKMVDNAKERNMNEVDENRRASNFSEISILETYLPKQLSESELKTILEELINSNGYTLKDMGKIMAFLKATYNGQYDGKLASELIKIVFTAQFHESGADGHS